MTATNKPNVTGGEQGREDVPLPTRDIWSPMFGYRHEFQPRELEAIKDSNHEHGFGVVKGLLASGTQLQP